ncbi:MAG: DUF4129 domain-containing protein [Ignavibacteria bacterium]|nr:DUF4129 domain-containing protein [Ignavibacteria bacterium]
MKAITILRRIAVFICMIILVVTTDTGAMQDSNTTSSEPQTHIEKIIRYDTTTTINERRVSRTLLEEYYIDEEFNYDREFIKQDSLWEMIKQKFWEIFESIFGNKDGDKIGDAITYILIAIAIAIVNIILFKSKLGGLFISSKKRASITFDAMDENIHELNFEDLLVVAEQNADYRRAVRLQYLWLLKRLADSNTIQWQINKTNRDYASEIHDKKLKRDFRQLSKIFEYAWYGDMTITAESYERTKALFLHVHQSNTSHEITA